MRKLNRIRIGETEYPILCDLNVLETLQEEFGNVNTFERKLLGLEYVKDENGQQVYQEDGRPRMTIVEPSIKAIKIALVEMINEGIAYEAYSEGKQWDMLDDLEILAMCAIPYTELSTIIHDEYKRCFETKKPMPREKKTSRSKKSTSLG